ncbi:MAG: dipeptidase [Gammaproteobacteria bacterium]
MRLCIAIAFISLSLVGCTSTSVNREPLTIEQRANALARSTLIVDTHIDVPYRLEQEFEDVSKATMKGDFDYPRAVAGGLNAPFMSIYIPAERETDGTATALADQLIDMVEGIASASPDKFSVAHSTADVERDFARGVMSLPMGMENGAPIAGDLANLKHFYDRGIRYITLTHSKSNHICDSSYDEARPWQGLSPFGETLVREMNNMGVMVDVSHVSDDAFYDVMKITKVPPVATHSSARHFTPGFERNMDDDMIKRLAAAGGVIQINYGSSFIMSMALANYNALKDARTAYLEENGFPEDGDEADAFTKRYRETTPFVYADVEDVIDHIDHVRDLVGIDYVGIGSDYDGVGDSLPTGLKDVASYPNLIAAMLKRGYSDSDVRKVLSGNLMRVWRETERYAATH